jgi:hypothetical protein
MTMFSIGSVSLVTLQVKSNDDYFLQHLVGCQMLVRNANDLQPCAFVHYQGLAKTNFLLFLEMVKFI